MVEKIEYPVRGLHSCSACMQGKGSPVRSKVKGFISMSVASTSRNTCKCPGIKIAADRVKCLPSI
eukprot:scaffold63389_cov18-Tisochrysis_lutea.AAC.1